MGWPMAPRSWSAETAPDRRFVVNAGQRASRKLQKHSSLLSPTRHIRGILGYRDGRGSSRP
jgi:hypothetical protein